MGRVRDYRGRMSEAWDWLVTKWRWPGAEMDIFAESDIYEI
jgi:hypothetical protein